MEWSADRHNHGGHELVKAAALNEGTSWRAVVFAVNADDVDT